MGMKKQRCVYSVKERFIFLADKKSPKEITIIICVHVFDCALYGESAIEQNSETKKRKREQKKG